MNLLLALLDEGHVFHERANAWFTRCLRQQIQVRVAYETVLACVRLAANPRVSTIISQPQETFQNLERLMGHPLFAFVSPDARSWTIFGEHLVGLRGFQSVPDLHLTAIAKANDLRLVTFDRDFLRIEGLDVELLPT